MSLYGKKEEVFVFLVEWHDVQSSLVRQYQLSYFVVDDTIEMYDIKNRRTFLKRCSYPSIKLEDLSPNELDAHAALDHWLQGEAERVEVGWLHVASEDTWGVLEELLGIHNSGVEVLLEVTGAEETRELTTDQENSALGASHREQ